MPSKVKPLTDAQLRVYESKRDLAAELLESVRQMKAGKTSDRRLSGSGGARAHRFISVAVRSIAWCLRAHVARLGARAQAAERCGANVTHDRPYKPEGSPGSRRQMRTQQVIASDCLRRSLNYEVEPLLF